MHAFDSGDPIKVAEYVKTIEPSQSVDRMISFRSQTGGFELLSIESSDPLHIRFRVKEKSGSNTALASLLVRDGNPPTVVNFALHALFPGVVPVNVKIDSALRKRVIDGINAELAESYIDAALATRMQEAIETHEKAGEYNSITDGDVFAERLTEDLRVVSHDKHLGVEFSPFKMPPEQPLTPEDIARMKQQVRHNNCALRKEKSCRAISDT